MASLVLYLEDGSTITAELAGELVTLGRHPESGIALSACPSVSTHHATLKLREDGWYVQDMGSSNGTRLNGATVEEAKLQQGDRVSFGDIQAIFYTEAIPEEAPVPEEMPEVPPVAPPPSASEQPAIGGRTSPPIPRPTRPAAAKKIPRNVQRSLQEQESGCMNTLFILLLLVGTVILGLALRHQRETGGNFFSDVFNKLTGGMPTITIEKKIKDDS